MSTNPPSSSDSTSLPPSPFQTTAALLAHLYADLTRLSSVSAPYIRLHTADRDLFTPPKPPLIGIAAAQAHEENLIAATGGTLVMDVQSITANEDFGCVLGVLRATKEGRGDLAVPFCGVWRFEGGWAVEHWENARGVEEFVRWLGE